MNIMEKKEKSLTLATYKKDVNNSLCSCVATNKTVRIVMANKDKFKLDYYILQ